MKLFLDDERMPANNGPDWIIERSSASAIQGCKLLGCPKFISFDHDLGGDDTAMAFVHWLINYDLDHPGFIPGDFSFDVHSQNPIGKANIEGLLNSYLRSKTTVANSN
jgi:hypothetical protein